MGRSPSARSPGLLLAKPTSPPLSSPQPQLPTEGPPGRPGSPTPWKPGPKLLWPPGLWAALDACVHACPQVPTASEKLPPGVRRGTRTRATAGPGRAASKTLLALCPRVPSIPSWFRQADPGPHGGFQTSQPWSPFPSQPSPQGPLPQQPLSCPPNHPQPPAAVPPTNRACLAR